MKSCTINESPLEKLIANCYTKTLSKIKVASGINVLVEKCPEGDIYIGGKINVLATKSLWKCYKEDTVRFFPICTIKWKPILIGVCLCK